MHKKEGGGGKEGSWCNKTMIIVNTQQDLGTTTACNKTMIIVTHNRIQVLQLHVTRQ